VDAPEATHDDHWEGTTMETVAAPPHRESLTTRCARLYAAAAGLIDKLQPVFALLLRLYVARVFFTSGMIKLGNWTGTLGLFENEYHVPLLPPHLAAVLGTAAEIGLPVFLVLGLGTRAAAFALFVFNIVAATSYPDLSPAGVKDHILWGTLLLVTLFYGPSKIAADEWFRRLYGA
jgi:putative oxidoreductase